MSIGCGEYKEIYQHCSFYRIHSQYRHVAGITYIKRTNVYKKTNNKCVKQMYSIRTVSMIDTIKCTTYNTDLIIRNLRT